MGPFDRFLIFRGLLFSSGATLVLAVTGVFTQGQRLVGSVANGGMDIFTFVNILLALLPSMIDGAMAVGAAVGIALLLVDLRATREILIQNALGLSPMDRLLPFAVIAVTLGMTHVVISTFIVPPSVGHHLALRNGYLKEANLWRAISPGRVIELPAQICGDEPDRECSIYAHSRADSRRFNAIRVVSGAGVAGQRTTYAERGIIHTANDQVVLLLSNGFNVGESSGADFPVATSFSVWVQPLSTERGGSISVVQSRNTEADGDLLSPSSLIEKNWPPGPTYWTKEGGIHVGNLRPEEILPGLAVNGARYVLENLFSDLDMTVQYIRVPSNEFHRRLATALLVGSVVIFVYTFLVGGLHLRRPPLGAYFFVGIVVVVALLFSRFAVESVAFNPKKFWLIYVGGLLPLIAVFLKSGWAKWS